MADTNPGGKVGRIQAAQLAELWGAEIEVKKSAVQGKRFPLYLSTSTGTVFLNTQRGQDFLLERGQFYGANDPKPEPVQAPAPVPVPVPGASHDPVEVPKGKRTFLAFLDEDIL